MKRGFTSVVLCTYNRAHLLKRSLECYKRQTIKNFELIILDDNSQDETEELVKSFSGELNIKYVKLEDKKPDEWRDAGAIINRGIKMTSGEFIYITHPEVMPCFNCLEEMNKILINEPLVYANSKTYYLTVKMQNELDDVDWKTDFYNIRKISCFYDEDDPLYDGEMTIFNTICTARFAEIEEVWYSWVFGGMTRKMWKFFGGLHEYNAWGSVDIDFTERRHELGIPTRSPKDVYIVHQNHDTPVGKHVPTKRTFLHCCEEVKKHYRKKKNFLEDMEL